MRSQASIEYLAIVAFLLGVLVIVIVYATSNVAQGTQTEQAGSSAQALADAIEAIGAQGPPARKSVTIILPTNIEAGSSISNYTVTLKLREAGMVREVVAYHNHCATGALPDASGAYVIDLFVDKDQCVKIAPS